MMSMALREQVEGRGARAGVPIEHDKPFELTLRLYHETILRNLDARFPGKTLSAQVASLKDELIRQSPELEKEFSNVRHWVNMGHAPGTPFDELRPPQAPRQFKVFAVFATALGLSTPEAAYFWQAAIHPIRVNRRIDGRYVSDVYARILFDPESAIVHATAAPSRTSQVFCRSKAQRPYRSGHRATCDNQVGRMTTVTVRVDPDTIPSSLKEAVVDALLNLTHARISGTGEFGRVLFGARPRSLLNSGFLLPARTDVEGDEVTSPIWVSAHGCDLQIARQATGEIRLQPRFAFYVRVLPNEDDIKRSDCRPSFRLKPEVGRRMRQRRYELLDKRWEEVKGAYTTSRGKHPDWLHIAEGIRQQVHKDEGVPLDLAQVGLPEDSDSDISPEAEGASAPTSGSPIIAKDEHFEPLNIPHKWLRLELELPALQYPVYANAELRAQAVAAHENAVVEAINKRLSEWLANTDSEGGGQLWAFRRDVEVKP